MKKLLMITTMAAAIGCTADLDTEDIKVADYKDGKLWASNIFFCALAGLLWYSQFFGLSLGRSFFEAGSAMDTLAFCILMALNVTFSNVWGIILKEWKGCSKKTIFVLVTGIAVLILSSFLPELLK